jgi:hypothetical protein
LQEKTPAAKKLIMPKASVKERIISSIKASSSAVFLRKEFDKFGDYRQVSRAIKSITKSGGLVRVGYGMYARARESTINGQPVPTETLLTIGLEVMKKIGVSADVGKDMRALREGKSTQVPMAAIICIGKARVQRKIFLGKRQVVYEKG